MIHLLSTWSKAYQPLADITWFGNKLRYAEKHGYAPHYVVHQDIADILWDRPQQWLNLLGLISGEWLWFSGTDLIVTQPSYKLEDYIDDAYELIGFVLNEGFFGDSFLIKSTPATLHLLWMLLNRRADYGNEQRGLATILSGSKDYDTYRIKLGEPAAPEARSFWASRGLESSRKFYRLNQELLNSTSVKVKILNPYLPARFGGDLNWIHYPPGHVERDDDFVPIYHRWRSDTFSLHMGSVTLEGRIRILGQLASQINWEGTC